MSPIRIVKHSVRTMARFKLRTGFMMLGSMVGVAALTFVLSAGRAAERKTIETVSRMFGDSAILIEDGGGHFAGGPRGQGSRLKLDDLDAIARELPNVESWDPQQGLPGGSVRHGDVTERARVMGESERSEHVWGRKASRGEYFDAAAVKAADRVAVVGETVVRTLFKGEDPLGAEIRIGSVPFRVIGVLEPWGTDPHGMDRDNEVLVPITTLMRRVTNVDTIASAKLLLRNSNDAERTSTEIRRILRARHALAANEPDDFTIITPAEVRGMVAQVQKVLFLYLPLVAGVALVGGALVSAILMLVSVNARTGEIGLRRAVGAGIGDIRLKFLVESAATTIAGGALGIALGYAAARAAASRMHLGEVELITTLLFGIAASTAVGLLAGTIPAMRAARLHPVDALR
jgi:putative ABC transport system permease protein